MKKYVFGSALAAELEMCSATFFNAVDADKNFPVYRIGNRKRFIRQEVLDYIDFKKK